MAAFDYFLKLDGIPGESIDAKHKGEIDVLSWSWGESQPSAADRRAAARGAGKVAMNRPAREREPVEGQPAARCSPARRPGSVKTAVLTAGARGARSQACSLLSLLSDVLVSALTRLRAPIAEAPARLDLAALPVDPDAPTSSSRPGRGSGGRRQAPWDPQDQRGLLSALVGLRGVPDERAPVSRPLRSRRPTPTGWRPSPRLRHDSAPPERCRALELGCGDGHNLVAMAFGPARVEHSSASTARRARSPAARRRSALGLENVRLEAGAIEDSRGAGRSTT